jgi:molecular chaperone Hsp33
MSHFDQLQRFIFDHADVRGAVVQLEKAHFDAITSHDYPTPVHALLSQFLNATVMLSTSLKFEGTITLQARSEGPISAIMADCTSHSKVRCIAQYDESLEDSAFEQPFNELFKDGVLVITIDPEVGKRYQGIVPLEADSLAGALAGYFKQSEQLDTKMWLFSSKDRSAGMMLQVLPGENVLPKAENSAFFEHACTLADTLSSEEILSLDATDVLHRLYHEEAVRVFEPSDVEFGCSCSIDKIAQALSSIPKAEMLQALEDHQGTLKVDCQFCNKVYKFGQNDLDLIYATPPKNTH